MNEPNSDSIVTHIDQLLSEMAIRPALTCPIRISWTGTEEEANDAGLLVRLFAQQQARVHAGLDFSQLIEIVFDEDYEAALRNLAPAGSGIKPTKEFWGDQLGSTLSTEEGSRILMHAGVAKELISDNPEGSSLARGMVLHELCHVSDYNFKRNLPALKDDDSPTNPLFSFFGLSAETLWNEYFANKYSHGPWSNPEVEISLLASALPVLRDRTNKVRGKSHSRRETGRLLSLAGDHTRYVAQYFGYAAGRLDAMQVTLDQQAPQLADLLEDLDLLRAWNIAFNTLKTLDATRSDWGDIMQLRDLVPSCQALMASFGIDVRLDRNGRLIFERL